MGTLTDILNRAQTRAGEAGLPYAGAVTPTEAFALLQNPPGTTLVDVRPQLQREATRRPASGERADSRSGDGEKRSGNGRNRRRPRRRKPKSAE